MIRHLIYSVGQWLTGTGMIRQNKRLSLSDVQIQRHKWYE